MRVRRYARRRGELLGFVEVLHCEMGEMLLSWKKGEGEGGERRETYPNVVP